MNNSGKYWQGSINANDDFDQPITDVFIDGVTSFGPWAIMNFTSFRRYGRGLGTGLGQKYEKQSDGRWLRVEG
jgi:hypothetical protein